MKDASNIGRPPVQIFLLPGGTMPVRMSKKAIGYDVSLRAIVSAHDMDPANPNLRQTLFDFEHIPIDRKTRKQVIRIRTKKNGESELIYRMRPGESVLAGIGFVTAMQFPLFYWIAPRSGLASKWGITVTNAPGTVDPDYRGEAGVLVYNRNKTFFDLRQNMRIAQILFQWAVIPSFQEIMTYTELSSTQRGAGGFGSTGLMNPR